MSSWNAASRRVSAFVDKFLDRALGASNDLRQRVPIYDPLERKFYLGKLLPMAVNIGGSEYKAKIAPCSYIVTFLVKGQPRKINLRITPSFNLYFRMLKRMRPWWSFIPPKQIPLPQQRMVVLICGYGGKIGYASCHANIHLL
jgi:hypothetical protein